MDEIRNPIDRLDYGLVPEAEGGQTGYSGKQLAGAAVGTGAVVGAAWLLKELLSGGGGPVPPKYANDSVHVIYASAEDCPETKFGRKFITFDNEGNIKPVAKGKYVEVLAFHDDNGNGKIEQYNSENPDGHSDPIYLFKFQSLQNEFGSEAHKTEVAEHLENFNKMMSEGGQSSTFHISTRPPGTSIDDDVTMIGDVIPEYTSKDGKKYKNVRVIIAPFSSIVYDEIIAVNGYLKDIADRDVQIELLQGQLDNASSLYNDFVNASAADRGRIANAINSAISEYGLNGSITSVAPHDPEQMVSVLAYINEALDNAWSGDYDNLSASSKAVIDGLNSSLISTEEDRKKLEELRDRLKADLSAYGVDFDNVSGWFDAWKSEKGAYNSKIGELNIGLKKALDNSAELKKELNSYLKKNPIAYDYHSQFDKMLELDKGAKAETNASKKNKKNLQADLKAAEIDVMVGWLKEQNNKENKTIKKIQDGLNRRQNHRKPRDNLPKTK